jgi:hypothetical protein
MLRSSALLWAAARKNVYGCLPNPPPCLSEPKYAALLFEHICFVSYGALDNKERDVDISIKACGAKRSFNVDHGLMIRLCGPCWRAK